MELGIKGIRSWYSGVSVQPRMPEEALGGDEGLGYTDYELQELPPQIVTRIMAKRRIKWIIAWTTK